MENIKPVSRKAGFTAPFLASRLFSSQAKRHRKSFDDKFYYYV